MLKMLHVFFCIYSMRSFVRYNDISMFVKCVCWKSFVCNDKNIPIIEASKNLLRLKEETREKPLRTVEYVK